MSQSSEIASILVVDDDDGLLALIAGTLRPLQNRVTTVDSAPAALAWLRENTPDLLLLDLKLRATPGSQLLDDLKCQGRTIPFIIITGQGDETVAVEMMKRGALDYLVKDLQFLDRLPAVILRTLDRIFTERRLVDAERRARLSQTVVEQNFSPILITTADKKDPSIVYLNGTFGATFGCDIAQLVNQPLSQLEKLTQGWGEFRRAIEKSQPFMGEMKIRTAKGDDLIFAGNITPVNEPGAAPAHWAVILRNITADKEAERALFRREQEFRALVMNSPDSISRVGPDFRHLYVNPALEKAFGLPAERLIGRTLLDAGMPADLAQVWNRRCHEVFQKGTERGLHFSLGPPASLRHYATRLVPEFNRDGKVESVLAVTTEITERKRLEREVLDISEREQRRFGHDLHDGLGQQLTGLEFTLHGLVQDLKDKAPSFVQPFEKMGDRLRETIRQTRAMSHGLSPVPLDDGGLMVALRELAASTTAASRVHCEVTGDDDIRTDDVQTATHLYRIAQEAVSNALKHGKPRSIALEVIDGSAALVLIIQDNGKGFAEENNPKGGMGLRVMRHRAETIGATLQVESKLRRGVRITCTLPKK